MPPCSFPNGFPALCCAIVCVRKVRRSLFFIVSILWPRMFGNNCAQCWNWSGMSHGTAPFDKTRRESFQGPPNVQQLDLGTWIKPCTTNRAHAQRNAAISIPRRTITKNDTTSVRSVRSGRSQVLCLVLPWQRSLRQRCMRAARLHEIVAVVFVDVGNERLVETEDFLEGVRRPLGLAMCHESLIQGSDAVGLVLAAGLGGHDDDKNPSKTQQHSKTLFQRRPCTPKNGTKKKCFGIPSPLMRFE